jgi:hypothetical protein
MRLPNTIRKVGRLAYLAVVNYGAIVAHAQDDPALWREQSEDGHVDVTVQHTVTETHGRGVAL